MYGAGGVSPSDATLMLERGWLEAPPVMQSNW
jgi:hypothetical protein